MTDEGSARFGGTLSRTFQVILAALLVAPQLAPGAESLRILVHSHTLMNGMKIFIYEDHSIPNVAHFRVPHSRAHLDFCEFDDLQFRRRSKRSSVRLEWSASC